MERRRFLNLLSFGAVGAAAPTVALANKQPVKSDPKDAPICAETLSLRNGTKLKPKSVDNNQLVFYTDNYEEYKQVSMAVGCDGNLWLKTEQGEWKRVVTE